MCTALTTSFSNHLFGRTLDLERRYEESVVITPRDYIFKYNSLLIERRHFAIIGMATVMNDYPLYYDATNEYGLSIAGLNFVGNSHYRKESKTKINLAPYELIPYLLGKYKSVDEVEFNLNKINLIDKSFDSKLPNAQLHWMISDKKRSITVECVKEGMKIYKNKVGILTNNPPFDYHLMNLNNYLNINNKSNLTEFAKSINVSIYSKGMSGIGLPGDNSSMSRFVRCVFHKFTSVVPNDNVASVTQFFHVLGSVAQVEGSVVNESKCDRTQYMSCCDMDSCIYYYKTYNNFQINAINMSKENLDASSLISYKMNDVQKINYIN